MKMADLLSTGISEGQSGYFSRNNEIITDFIESILRFLFTGMVFTLLFLGALQAKFGYPNTMQEDLSKSMQTLSNSFFNIYQLGQHKPNFYFWITIISMAIAFCWVVWDFIDLIRTIKKK
jgi:hypothetical protein